MKKRCDRVGGWGRSGGRAGVRRRSRYDRRFYAVGAILLAAAIAGKALGADAFSEYPTVAVGLGPATLALSALLLLAGFAPFRRSPVPRVAHPTPRSQTASNSLPARGGI